MIKTPRWQAVIELRAALALQVIEEMADKALADLGFSKQYINRRRGQIRRHRKQGDDK